MPVEDMCSVCDISLDESDYTTRFAWRKEIRTGKKEGRYSCAGPVRAQQDA